jgi:membrane associated rhomboid family serine protease
VGSRPARTPVTLHNAVNRYFDAHVGVVHLVMNMWFLFVFGDAVEDALGPW